MSEGPRAFFKTYLPRDMSFAISDNSDNSGTDDLSSRRDDRFSNDRFRAGGFKNILETFSTRLKNAALRMVTRRRLTEHQLRTALEKKISSKWYDMFRSNISADVMHGEIRNILTRFRELGYVNDTDFVELYARDILEHRPHGFLWIRAQLKKKGIEADIIARVLAKVRVQHEEMMSHDRIDDSGTSEGTSRGSDISRDVEYLGARTLAEKKMRTLRKRDERARSREDEKNYRNAKSDVNVKIKLFRFLCGRGYPTHVVLRVLEELKVIP